MAKEFWFKFYFKDWAADVKPLSLAARGMLIELIIHLREHDGEMPADIRLIGRLTGCLTEEATEILSELKKFAILNFENRSGQEFLVSRKIKKEISKSLTNSENGKKGGNPLLISDKRMDNRTDNQTHNSIFNSISESVFQGERGTGKGEPEPPDGWLTRFTEEIKSIWPNRDGLHHVERAMSQAVAGPDHAEAIMKKIRQYVELQKIKPSGNWKFKNWMESQEYLNDFETLLESAKLAPQSTGDGPATSRNEKPDTEDFKTRMARVMAEKRAKTKNDENGND